MKLAIRIMTACMAFAVSLAAQAQNYSDIWFNPSESGWGLTIADHQSQLFAVWFTYRADGKPTWYVIPGGTFTNNHTHFVGDIYSTTGPAFSSASFDPSRVTVTKAGTATIDFSSFTAGTFTYSVAGVTQTKAIQRQPFGNATPLWGRDVTDIWYNPMESGWGLTLAQHGNNVFGVWFTYDTDGQPLWAVMPGATFNGASEFTGTLYTTTGPAFSSVPFDSSRVAVKQDGNVKVTVSKAQASAQCGGAQAATLQTTLRGASRQSSICQQPFGKVAALPDFPDNPAFGSPAAYFSAPANPLNAIIGSDASARVSQLVTTAGGSIVATDARGNRFTLDVPPNALTSNTVITMTPITSVSGPRYASGIALGLKLEPDGLVLEQSAILTVEPATAFPLASQTGFSAGGTGNDMVFAPPGPDFSRMQLHVAHFSFWGWLFMSAEERAAEKRMAEAAKEEVRIRGDIAKVAIDIKREYVTGVRDSFDPPPSAGQMTALKNQFYENVVKPRLQSAKSGCGNAMVAYDTLLKFNREASVSGIYDELPTFESDKNTLRSAFAELVKKTPCLFVEEGDSTALDGADPITTTFTAAWRATSQDGHVVTYKALQGFLQIELPGIKPCGLANPRHSVTEGANALSQLDIDWDAGTYRGVGGAQPALTITCPDQASVTFPFAIFYFGDRSSPDARASGRLNASKGIGKETRPAPLGTITYTFTPACESIFCG